MKMISADFFDDCEKRAHPLGMAREAVRKTGLKVIRRAAVLLLLFAVLLSCGAAPAEGTAFAFLGAMSWDTPEGEADLIISRMGFNTMKAFDAGDSKYLYYDGKINGQTAKWLSLYYADGRLNGIFFYMLKGEKNYSRTVSALTKTLGKASQGQYAISVNGQEEKRLSLVWENDDTKAYLTGINGNNPTKCSKGKSAFRVSIIRKGTDRVYELPDFERNRGKIPDVAVHTYKVTKKSNGSTVEKIAIRNYTDRTIDRARVQTYYFNADGQYIPPLGNYRYKYVEFQFNAKPGKSSAAQRYKNTGCEGARKAEVAVTAYTFKDGETVEIPEEDWVWITVEF